MIKAGPLHRGFEGAMDIDSQRASAEEENHLILLAGLDEITIWVWVNYNDLTATSLESWLLREIIPKWP